MGYTFNKEIETALSNLGVPVAYMFYEGNENTYVTYMQIDKADALAGDDAILGCIQYYDFDVYSTGNYFTVVDNLIKALTEIGWTYQPSRDSPDLYERDTKLYHKTICLAKESEV